MRESDPHRGVFPGHTTNTTQSQDSELLLDSEPLTFSIMPAVLFHKWTEKGHEEDVSSHSLGKSSLSLEMEVPRYQSLRKGQIDLVQGIGEPDQGERLRKAELVSDTPGAHAKPGELRGSGGLYGPVSIL